MSKKANELRKQIEDLQAQLDKLEKPSQDVINWKGELSDLQEAIKSARGNIKYFHEQIAAEEKEIVLYEKDSAKLKALIEKAKKPKRV
jgi:chromosome segregation ATPase